MGKIREETKKLIIDIGDKTDEIMFFEPKLRKALEDLESCKEMLMIARNEHSSTVSKLEAAEDYVKMADIYNSEVKEKSIKLAEANSKAQQEKCEAEEKLELAERSLRAANRGMDKLVEEVEKKEREYVSYQEEVERQLVEVLDM